LLAWPKVSKKNSALTLGKGRSNMMLIILVKMGERERSKGKFPCDPPTNYFLENSGWVKSSFQ
jgi:hypothetical protein